MTPIGLTFKAGSEAWRHRRGGPAMVGLCLCRARRANGRAWGQDDGWWARLGVLDSGVRKLGHLCAMTIAKGCVLEDGSEGGELGDTGNFPF
jgi:hypothetical protein